MLLPGFKAYDIRGQVPNEINERFAQQLGRAFVCLYHAKSVVVGYDSRLTSPKLYRALAEGICEMGADLYFLGECGTEEVYFQTAHLKADGGIMITASHNPINENGMKLVGPNATPISLESGLRELSDLISKGLAEEALSTPPRSHFENLRGDIIEWFDKRAYIDKLCSFIPEPMHLKPLTIVVNAGNGTAGRVIDQLETKLPFHFIKLNHHPDGHFPNGIPNPLLPERRIETEQAVIEHQADFGVAWDGDFDRCFLFDHRGRYIDSCYLIALLARALLEENPDETIVIDTRVQWVIREMVTSLGGEVISSSGGHSPMKASMRTHRAIYGGESSAHHYFRDFNYCDSGMIPWLLIASLLSTGELRLSAWIDRLANAYPYSGEINFQVRNDDAILQKIEQHYAPLAHKIDYTDGLSMEFAEDWRFNLRSSNTEPLLRLNIESRHTAQWVDRKVAEMRHLIEQLDSETQG